MTKDKKRWEEVTNVFKQIISANIATMILNNNFSLMISFSDLLSSSKEKTRVLIYAVNPSISKLILEVLNFAGKEFDFFLTQVLPKTTTMILLFLKLQTSKKPLNLNPLFFLFPMKLTSKTSLQR